MSNHKLFNYHPLTLSFRGQFSYLEPIFLRFSRSNLFFYRLVLLSGILLYAAFGFFDALLVSGVIRSTLLQLRLLLVCPVLFLILLASYHPGLRRLMQPLTAIGIFLAGSVLVIMMTLVPTDLCVYYHAGLMLVFMYTYGIGQIRFPWATASGLAVLAFFLFMTYINDIGHTNRLTGLFFFISANIIGMITTYALDYFSRKNFFLRHQLRQKEQKLQQLNGSLEKTVKKRTFSLVHINNKLNSEIQERIRTEKERQQIEAQLIQAQKMEAIGTLAGGIAHDFNNILAIINGVSELALLTSDENKKEYDAFRKILKAGRRAKELVAQILTFSRHEPLEDTVTDLVPLFKGTINLICSTAPATITIRKNVIGQRLYVQSDATRLDQIIMNLCTNAIHALEPDGGILTIELQTIDLDQAIAKQHPGIAPGPYVELLVADSGPGMAKGVVDHIFEPFFTTKEKGRGTGLGLSVVHGIVKSLKGTILVDTEPGTGTTFRVWLPLVEQTTTPSTVERHCFDSVQTAPARQILLIDDEPELVSLGIEILSELGYQVTGYTDPQEALDFFKNNPDFFDVVVTDLNMPGLTGDKVAETIRAIRPHLPVLFSTGDSSKLAKTAGLAKAEGLLLKPVSILDYERAIRNALDK